MKKLKKYWIAAFFVFAGLLQSCDDDEGYSIGDIANDWVTIRVEGEGVYSFTGDTWGTMYPAANAVWNYSLVEGQRAFLVFNPLFDNYYGYDVGFVNDEVYLCYLNKMNRIHAEIERLDTIHFSPKSEINNLLEEKGSTRLKEGVTARAILQRPELVYEDLLPYIEHVDLTEEEMRRVTILIKYKGYIEKTLRQVEKVKNMEEKQIPADLDYDDVLNLSLEARQKLKKVRPVTIGQATRISGINPADISVLLIHLKTQYGD